MAEQEAEPKRIIDVRYDKPKRLKGDTIYFVIQKRGFMLSADAYSAKPFKYFGLSRAEPWIGQTMFPLEGTKVIMRQARPTDHKYHDLLKSIQENNDVVINYDNAIIQGAAIKEGLTDIIERSDSIIKNPVDYHLSR